MATAQDGKPDFHAHARLLLKQAKMGTLATAEHGVPYAALVTPAFLPHDFTPILLLSEMSAHTRQLRANPACALLIMGEPADENPQTAPRLCLSGIAAPDQDPASSTLYLAAHPYAALYASFTDFMFWRMEITAIHYIGGFAAAARLDVTMLRTQPPVTMI